MTELRRELKTTAAYRRTETGRVEPRQEAQPRQIEKHSEQEDETPDADLQRSKGRGFVRTLLLGVAAAALVSGIGLFAHSGGDDVSRDDINAAAAAWQCAPVSDAQVHGNRNEAPPTGCRMVIRLLPQDLVDQTNKVQVDEAIQAMRLPPASTKAPAQQSNVAPKPSMEQQLRSDIEQQKVRLVSLTLWDTHDEDHDMVRVTTSMGFDSGPIDLKKRPTSIKVPVPAASGEIQIHSVADGGGGITLGLSTSGGVHRAPVMMAGQILTIPFSDTEVSHAQQQRP